MGWRKEINLWGVGLILGLSFEVLGLVGEDWWMDGDGRGWEGCDGLGVMGWG